MSETSNNSRAEEPLEVMVLGTYHMNDPEGGIIEVETDDVLKPVHQEDLERIAEAFVEWKPDHVAVEVPTSAQNAITAEYERYRAGDDFAELSPQEELVQLGFRICDKLDHSKPLAVDQHFFYEEFPDGYSDEFVAWWTGDREIDSELRVDMSEDNYGGLDIERTFEGSIPEILERLNSERVYEYMSRYRYRVLDWTHDDTAKYVGQWQARNAHIVHNVLSESRSSSRVLLLMGAGHLTDLKYILEQTPSTRWQSAHPILSRVTTSSN